MQPVPSRRKRWLIRTIKLLVLVLVVWAVRRTLIDAWNQLDEHRWHLEPIWLGASAGLYLAGLLPAALFWHRVLHILGQRARLRDTMRAYYIGHLGKYVPGKAMVVVLRTGLIRGERVDTGVAAASVFVETLTMMAVGSFLAAAILAVWFREEGWIVAGAVGLMLVSGLPTIPKVFRHLARLAGVGKDPATAAKLERLGWGALLLGWMGMAVGWCLMGLSYWAVLRAMEIPGLDPLVQLPRYTAAVSLAMVAGFLLLVLPGGMGVREAALVKLMVPYLTELTPHAELAAWASAAVLRIVWLLSELGISGILYMLGVVDRSRSAPTEPIALPENRR
ncbi:MAG: flippase-like domain-containing protein [Rhodopirellula sp.]|nr:flippase-like domain-containing protein [Rhodopirellula sp.]